MGNRAVICTEAKDLGVYLHWNGGRDSVEAFLFYCKLKGYRKPELDNYGWARLCQVIGNFFGGEYSVGIDVYDKLDTDNGDNGVYIIKDWQIIDKEFEPLEDRDEEQFRGMVEAINGSMGVSEQIDKETLEKEIDNYLSGTITVKQIKAIHTLVNKIGYADREYRALLDLLFKVKSCKELTRKQAEILIDTLSKLK